jgi:hypothetical protein
MVVIVINVVAATTLITIITDERNGVNYRVRNFATCTLHHILRG